MSEFDYRRVFSLTEEAGKTLNVAVMFDNTTKEPLSVSFSDPERDQMVSVDFDLWARVVASIQRNLQY